MHLLGLAVAKGLDLQTRTPVTHVTSSPDTDGRYTITTPRGTMTATKVVFASNGFTAGILPEYSQKIVSCRETCSRILTPDPNKAPYLNSTYVLRTGPGMYDYLIPRVDGSIIVGGANAAMSKDKSVWYDNANDNELIEPAKDYFGQYMQRLFMGWEERGAYVDKVWTGSKLISEVAILDQIAVVGPVDDKPNYATTNLVEWDQKSRVLAMTWPTSGYASASDKAAAYGRTLIAEGE